MADDSLWGYGHATLTDPVQNLTDSEWGYGHVTLENPAAVEDSAWAFGHVTLRNPHQPIAVMTATGIRYVPILSFDGTDWR